MLVYVSNTSAEHRKVEHACFSYGAAKHDGIRKNALYLHTSLNTMSQPANETDHPSALITSAGMELAVNRT
jgi:hypothetical protein